MTKTEAELVQAYNNLENEWWSLQTYEDQGEQCDRICDALHKFKQLFYEILIEEEP